MVLFNTHSTPVFLKEDSTTSWQIARLKELKEQATGKVKDDIAREITLATYGEAGEKNIAFELKNAGIPMYIIHDLHLQCADLSAQIDYVVVTRKLNFFIECKNLYGNIEIDSQGNFVRSYPWNGKIIKEAIYSPITQNQRHLDVFKQTKRPTPKNAFKRRAFEKYFDASHKSIIVLANPKTILDARYAKKEVIDKVIRADQLIALIKNSIQKSKAKPANDADLKARAEEILALHTPLATDYFKKYEARLNKQPLTTQQHDSDIANVIHEATESYRVVDLSTPAVVPNDIIVKQLKTFRLETSRKEKVQAYVVFNDRQLADLISQKPKTLAELRQISGFGPIKAEKYGPGILAILQSATNPAPSVKPGPTAETTTATPEKPTQCLSAIRDYQSYLVPNKKSTDLVIAYLARKYPLKVVDTAAVLAVVTGNITENPMMAEKCPPGRALRPVVFHIPRQGGGVFLYEQQEAKDKDSPIMVGLEHETGYVAVEGCSFLAEELVAFVGLDQADLSNEDLVDNYIACREKYGLLTCAGLNW